MAIYKETETSGEQWLLGADMAQAAAPITYAYHQHRDEPEWESTPFQTADAQHRIARAAALVLHYIDRASCAEDVDQDIDCDCAKRIVAVDDIAHAE